MPTPRVRAVVLNYNGGDHVIRCLHALEATDWGGELELVVVDNASTDGSPDEIARRFPAVDLRHNADNTGFPANNLALADLVGIEYVALVNNDAFVEPTWLEPLVAELESDPELGAVCPRIVFEPKFALVELSAPVFGPVGQDPRALGVRLHGVCVAGAELLAELGGDTGVHGLERDEHGRSFRWTADHARIAVPVDEGTTGWRIELDIEAPVAGSLRVAGDAFSVAAGERRTVVVDVSGPPVDVVNNAGSVVLVDGSSADRGYQQPDGPEFDSPAEVAAWCGAGVLMRSDYLADVGLFDERYFMYYEDTDLSWRGRARGWRYRYVPDSRVRHLHAATSVEGSPMFRYFVERNRLVTLAKNASSGLAVRAAARFVLTTASYARRGLVPAVRQRRSAPLGVVRDRGRSFGGFLRMLPGVLRQRRAIRRRALWRPDQLESALVGSPRVGDQ